MAHGEGRRTSTTTEMSPLVKWGPFVLTVIILPAVVVTVLAAHVFQAWAAAHPAAYRRHFPHFWQGRLAALCVLVAFRRMLIGEVARLWRALRAWQCARPWSRRRAPEETREAQDG